MPSRLAAELAQGLRDAADALARMRYQLLEQASSRAADAPTAARLRSTAMVLERVREDLSALAADWAAEAEEGDDHEQG
jgi:hypothetical protein